MAQGFSHTVAGERLFSVTQPDAIVRNAHYTSYSHSTSDSAFPKQPWGWP